MMLKQQLQKEIESGNVLFLVGTGVSFGATNRNALASWLGLIENGITESVNFASANAELAALYRQLLQSKAAGTNELISVAEFVTEQLKGPNGGDFRAWLRKSVGCLRADYREVLEALRDLPGLFATTNYDGLLEEVTGLDALTWRQENEVELVLNGRQKGILHLHGFWRDSASIVLGIRSYEKVLHNAHAQTMLRTILTAKTVVFVGCGEGLSDPNFGALLDWARPVFAGSERVHYRLARDCEVDKLRAQHKDDRIKIVSYGADFDALAPFLRSLAPRPGPGTSGSGGGTTSSAASVLSASGAFPKLEDARVMRPFRDISALRELAKVLQEATLSWDFLNQKFWQSVPKSWCGELAGLSVNEYERCANLVDELSRYGAQTTQGRTFPLLEFVLRMCLAPECGATKALLRAWLERNAPMVDVSPTTVHAEEQRLIGALYLLVQLEHASRDGLLVQAWLGDDTGAPLRPLPMGDKPLRREEIPAALGRLWDEDPLRERLGIIDSSKLTLEFILPQDLLSLSVDEWKIPPSPVAVPIGSQYRVVVRSLERVYALVSKSLENDFLRAPVGWKKKWNVLLQRAEKTQPVWVMSSEDHEQDQLLARLFPDDVVCLALALTSPLCPDETRQQVLQWSILHGIPIALWSRQEGTKPDTIRGFLSPLLHRIRELPDALREARWHARLAGTANHPGHYLSLLWDDPERVPPNAKPGADLCPPPFMRAN